MKEIKIVLNEATFTTVCKAGFLTYIPTSGTKIELAFTYEDVKKLTSGEIISKTFSELNFLIALQDIGKVMIKEILMRSPVFSNLSSEIQ
jgi:hypothetical protein